MKAYWGNRGIAPRILHLGSRWRWSTLNSANVCCGSVQTFIFQPPRNNILFYRGVKLGMVLWGCLRTKEELTGRWKNNIMKRLVVWTVDLILSRWLSEGGWEGAHYVSRIRKMRNASSVFVGKPQVKRTRWRLLSRWECDEIKIRK
jgi:hypothetical protein